MEPLFLFLLTNLFVYSDVANDPIHANWEGATAGRKYECERLPQAEAHRRYPGEVPQTSAIATTLFGVDALVCEHRVMPDGARSPRDEAVLRDLSDNVDELVGLAAAAAGEDTQWVVDAYYPDPAVVRKVASAARVSLAERGLPVSDAPPQFTAGDVEVFRTLPMRDAIPASCRRWWDIRAQLGQPLRRRDAFLALALLDQHESQLHVGLCQGGTFRWLR